VEEDVLDPRTREGLEGFTQGSLEGLGVVPPPPPPTPMRQHWRAAGQMLMGVLAMVAGGAMAVGGTGLAVGAGWTGVGAVVGAGVAVLGAGIAGWGAHQFGQGWDRAHSANRSGGSAAPPKFKWTQKATTKANADILRREMIAKGEKFATGDYAHHMVLSTHPRAKAARDILKKYKVDINSHFNGVRLTKSQHYGQRLHSGDSMDALTLNQAFGGSKGNRVAPAEERTHRS
jgi:hypothetical protein